MFCLFTCLAFTLLPLSPFHTHSFSPDRSIPLLLALALFLHFSIQLSSAPLLLVLPPSCSLHFSPLCPASLLPHPFLICVPGSSPFLPTLILSSPLLSTQLLFLLLSCSPCSDPLCFAPLLSNLFLFCSLFSFLVLMSAPFLSVLLYPFSVALSMWSCVCLLVLLSCVNKCLRCP